MQLQSITFAIYKVIIIISLNCPTPSNSTKPSNLYIAVTPTRTTLRSQVEQLTLATKSSDQQPKKQQLQTHNQELVTQLQSLQQSVIQLQQGLTTEQQKSSELERRCRSLETTLSTEQEKSSALDTRCQSLETRCESLELSLAAEKQKVQSLEARCNSQEERLKGVEDTVERLWAISRDEINLSNKILGTGGWGYVTEATFRGRRVAAKCLHEAIISPHNQELFAKEMKISARCRHKNLVEFIGAVPDHPAIIVIEMMDCTLRFALSSGRVIPNHIHPISTDVAQGLIYLHSIQPHPLIHRDVSAPNVLLKAVGAAGGWIAKLSDLGSAQFANIAQTLAPGCVLYAAPEVQQRDTAHRQTEKIDVYSYGVLLIEILTREMPTGVLSQLINSLIPIWPQFISLIQRCTNTDPTRRPTMREVITSLNKITI